jgi:hypothetical protein
MQHPLFDLDGLDHRIQFAQVGDKGEGRLLVECAYQVFDIPDIVAADGRFLAIPITISGQTG